MRLLIMTAGLSLLGVAAPSAQTPAVAPAAPPAASLGPPRAFQGYSQPEITASYCRVVNPGQITCTLPAMTAGRYMVVASGTSTATAAGASQKLAVLVGNRNCGVAERKPSPQAPWAKGAKTIRLNCEIMVLTDRPLPVTVVYVDDKATRSAAGPTLRLERVPWEGVLLTTVAPTTQDP
ncbi:hypothetical protein MCEMIH16_01606 [Caulobacteraceae bacterium]